MINQQPEKEVFAGVDTHTDTHHAAVVDPLGRPLGDREFPTTTQGYRALLMWLITFGHVQVVGVECTASYGGGLTTVLSAADLTVVEVNAPDRGTRHTRGKADPIDAYAAARAAASGRATAIPKSRTGMVEALRQLRVARASAIKARTQAINQLIGLRVTAPEPLRASLTGLTRTTLVNRCLLLRPGADLTCPTEAARYALRQLARRIRMLTEEIDEVTERLTCSPRPPVLSSSHYLAWVQRPPVSSWSLPATTPNGCARKPRSPLHAAPLQFRLPSDAPTDIDSAEAETARPTAPST